MIENWEAFIAPIQLSLKISLVSSVLVFLIAFVAARWMTRRKFFGQTALEAFIMLPLVLPPTVIGFILLVLLGKQGTLGKWFHALTGENIIFTWGAGVIAAVVVAFPLVYQMIKSGFITVDPDLENVARSMGANEWQVLAYITVPLMMKYLGIAYVLGFARALGEFGATLMIAGNIPGVTQTVPTAIYVAVDSGNMVLAAGWVGCMVIFSFILMYFVRQQQ